MPAVSRSEPACGALPARGPVHDVHHPGAPDALTPGANRAPPRCSRCTQTRTSCPTRFKGTKKECAPGCPACAAGAAPHPGFAACPHRRVVQRKRPWTPRRLPGTATPTWSTPRRARLPGGMQVNAQRGDSVPRSPRRWHGAARLGRGYAAVAVDLATARTTSPDYAGLVHARRTREESSDHGYGVSGGSGHGGSEALQADTRPEAGKPPTSGRVLTPSGSPGASEPWQAAPTRRIMSYVRSVRANGSWCMTSGRGTRCSASSSGARIASGQEHDPLAELCGLSYEMQGWTFANTGRSDFIAEAYDTARELDDSPAPLPERRWDRQDPAAGLHRQRGEGCGNAGGYTTTASCSITCAPLTLRRRGALRRATRPACVCARVLP